MSAQDDLSPRAPDWRAVEQSPEFRALTRAKRAFLVPACLAFIVYYFALPVLVGYWPDLMSRRVIGRINIAYVFALSQFAMAWLLMFIYIRRARTFDRMAEQVVRRQSEIGR